MLLSRFRNPAIGDQLLRICSDGAAKLPVFVQDTARETLARGGDHRRIAFLLASFTEYLRGTDDRGESFPVVEPNVSAADHALAADVDLARGLEMNVFAGWGLERYPAFTADYVRFRDSIKSKGAGATLTALLNEAGGG